MSPNKENIPDAMRQFAIAEQFPDRVADSVDMLKRGAQQILACIANKARSVGIQDIDVEVEEGPIARTIVSRGKNHKADMIVLGSRGMGDMQGLLRGGMSHRVELLAKCPVLIVK